MNLLTKAKFLFFFCPAILFSFFSCDVMKKRYSSGFYFSGKNTLPTRNVKEMAQSQRNSLVNQNLQLNQSNSSITNNDKPEITTYNLVTNRQVLASQEQRTVLANYPEKMSWKVSSFNAEKSNPDEKINNFKSQYQRSGGETNSFSSKKTLSGKYHQVVKKISDPYDTISVIGRVLMVILLVFLLIVVFSFYWLAMGGDWFW